jgi:hypothetical protein
MDIPYSLALCKTIFTSYSTFKILLHVVWLGTHWLLPHQSSSITFTGYQFIITLTSISLFLKSKSSPSANLAISLLLSSLTLRLDFCVSQANISFNSPELAQSLEAVLSAQLHVKYGITYPSLFPLLLPSPHLSFSLNPFTSLQLSLTHPSTLILPCASH